MSGQGYQPKVALPIPMRVIGGGGFFLARLIAGKGFEHAKLEVRLAPLAHINKLDAPPTLLAPAI